ncbi:metallophosphoesterase [Anaerolentibacter hominis]|uniref:metallophosphoesterase family protein n=1 Tax=Anaerolentibacter hominis TaxID=3079009 RepID=UPI0031B89AFB
MRIGFISDIHIDYNRHYNFVDLMAEAAERKQLDYLVFLGDTCTGGSRTLEFYDRLAKRTAVKIREIPGNHDQYVWPVKGKTGEQIRAEARVNYHLLNTHPEYSLWKHPVVTKDWLITGLCGWYDFSFQKGYPNIDTQKYAAKWVAGGLWPDIRFIDGGRVNAALDARRVERDMELLAPILENPAYKGKKRCVAMHMIPTKLLVTRHHIPFYMAGVNFLGSEKYRAFFEKHRVALSVSGHSHMAKIKKWKGITYANVSLGYGFQWRRPGDALAEIMEVMYVISDEKDRVSANSQGSELAERGDAL